MEVGTTVDEETTGVITIKATAEAVVVVETTGEMIAGSITTRAGLSLSTGHRRVPITE